MPTVPVIRVAPASRSTSAPSWIDHFGEYANHRSAVPPNNVAFGSNA